MVLLDVKPCEREFCDDFAKPAAVRGPLDLAPLTRAVSDFSLDGIRVYPVSSLSDGSGRAPGFCGAVTGNIG
jgi:hypothetical protein